MGLHLTQEDIIIIVVVAVIAALILAAILYRLVRYVQSGSSAPLPPIQSLAHHKHRELERLSRKATSRSPTYYDNSDVLLVPSLNSSFQVSKTSLLPKSGPVDTSGLEPPHLNISPSDSSLESLNHSPETPVSHASPIEQRQSSVSSRPRPLSLSSVATTSMSRRSTIRGTPHSRPKSQVQIVLPAPLAPNLFPNMAPETGSYRQSLHADESVIDKWTPVPSRSVTPRSHESRHSTSSARLSGSYSRRTSLNLPSPPSSSSSHFHSTDAPPVPRIPPVYNTTTGMGSPDRGPQSRLPKATR